RVHIGHRLHVVERTIHLHFVASERGHRVADRDTNLLRLLPFVFAPPRVDLVPLLEDCLGLAVLRTLPLLATLCLGHERARLIFGRRGLRRWTLCCRSLLILLGL